MQSHSRRPFSPEDGRFCVSNDTLHKGEPAPPR